MVFCKQQLLLLIAPAIWVVHAEVAKKGVALDDAWTNRTLQESYVEPSYWERYRGRFDKVIKRCKFQNNVVPENGSPCPRMFTGDYTCLFGEQTCPDGLTHPTTTCDCTEPDREFLCEPYEACTSVAVGQTCPNEHPAYAQTNMACSKEGLTCNYGNQTCCGSSRYESTCSCTNGLFECTNDDFCQYECPVPYSSQKLRVAKMLPFPGYSGPTEISGEVTVRFNPDDTLAIKFSLQGLEAGCVDCGIHIHSGTDCNDAGGHYWDRSKLGEKDIWWSDSAVYNTDNTGAAESGFYMNSTYGFEENSGRVVVVHDSKGTKVGCGILAEEEDKSSYLLAAQMDRYPGFEDTTIAPEGQVIVEVLDDNSLKYSFDVSGLPMECQGCGAHIHSGTSCRSPADPKGHYWDSNWSQNDPWSINNGATWSSDIFGNARGSFFIYSGYGRENTDRAIVFHRADGVKIACGILKEVWSSPDVVPPSTPNPVAVPTLAPTAQPITPVVSAAPTNLPISPVTAYSGKKLFVANMATFPGYVGPTRISGGVSVRFNPDDSLMMKFVLYGLESNCTDCGIHIHSGTSCNGAGGHYWDKSKLGDKDIWWSESAVYNTNSIGFAESGFYIDSGYGFAQNSGHVVVVHDSQGTKVGCGVLAEADDASSYVLQAQMGTYPGLGDDTISPSGTVTVEVFDDDSLRYSFDVKDLPANCDGCGAHIHSGSSCATPADPQGHYWNTNWSANDPWNAKNGATWDSDSLGVATGSFFVYNGYGRENTDRAIVFHRADGVKVACGILKDTPAVFGNKPPSQPMSNAYDFSAAISLGAPGSNLNDCSPLVQQQVEALIKAGIEKYSSGYTKVPGATFPFPLEIVGGIAAETAGMTRVRRRLQSSSTYNGSVGCQYCRPGSLDPRYSVSGMEDYVSENLSDDLGVLALKLDDLCFGSENIDVLFKLTNLTQSTFSPTPGPTLAPTSAPTSAPITGAPVSVPTDGPTNPLGISVCPSQTQALKGPTCEEDLRCAYGTETCCGETYDSLVCTCSAGGRLTCLFSDACQMADCQTPVGTTAPTGRPTRRPTKFLTAAPSSATPIPTLATVAPTAAPITSTPVTAAPVPATEPCTRSLLVTDGLLLEYALSDTTFKVKLTYAGIGWVGFGRSTGGMIGSEVVIGSSEPVQKYRLNGKAASMVNPELPQTLTDTAFIQNSTHTVLEYTKILEEDGELTISSSESTFVWAYGWDNTLAYHRERGSSTIQLEEC